MPNIRVYEQRRQKRTYNESPSETREYVIEGSSDISVIEAALSSATHVTYPPSSQFSGISGSTIGTLILKSVDISQSEEGDGLWTAVANWGKAKKREQPEKHSEEISFDISPQTTKITQSLGTITKTGIGVEVAPDFKGGIGYNGKTFQGCDKVVGSLSFTITQYKPIENITNAFVQQLEECVGCVNNNVWRGRQAGEVLFMGVSGSKRSEDDYQLAFKFQSQPNASGLSVGEITGIQKGGWEHLWILYEDHEDASASPKYVAKKPRAAYVERVYNSVSFPTQLGITA